MGSSTIPHSDLAKGMRAISWCLRHPRHTLRSVSRGLAQIYRQSVDAVSELPMASLHEIAKPDHSVSLANFEGRDGNVSLYELLVISSLVRSRAPKTLLEIGTFDGNTSLQMAVNSPEDAKVYTLDLPPDVAAASAELDPMDRAYIEDEGKQQRRRYEDSSQAHKVVQLIGDSASFDFKAQFAERKVDLAFIDGSHSYEYVQNDTEKVLELLAPEGVVLWHDYKPAWPGVIKYLEERMSDLPLRRIRGTSLVFLDGALR
ncbi:MAG: class I SAM-dependent methyltransferase [Planctomycetota bacterium]|jgi:predicted O-methyltransferase YrrM